jgi:hypothetical protein
VIVDVARNLDAMQPEQYVLAFLFLGSYAFALGKLFERRGRTVCAALAFVAAVGFIACCSPWEQGVMLVALALVGIGAFSGGAWLFWAVATWRETRLLVAAAPEAAARPPLALVQRLRAGLLHAATRSS